MRRDVTKRGLTKFLVQCDNGRQQSCETCSSAHLVRPPAGNIERFGHHEQMSASATEGFRSDLEGLRGVAILLVVACHCGIPWCAGGFIGVDVFFVLSGYLITGLLVEEHRTTSRIDLPGFFARRVRRLIPAALLVILLTLVAAVALLSPQEIETTARSAIAAACYLS